MIGFACSQPTSTSTQLGRSFPAVPIDELAFALGVFMAAANCVLLPLGPESNTWSEGQTRDCGQLLAGLLGSREAIDPRRVRSCQASLDTAFCSLWKVYSTHCLRDSLCARVLRFHLLMEQTEGKLIAPWTTACPDQPEEVQLHPVVVEALASVPLHSDSQLPAAAFLVAIQDALDARCPAAI